MEAVSKYIYYKVTMEAVSKYIYYKVTMEAMSKYIDGGCVKVYIYTRR